MSLATWPNYHDPATFEGFTAKTGVAVEVNVFGSNEEMLAKLQAGASGWSLFVPTNYTISTYHKLGLIDELDLSKLPNFSTTTENPRFTKEGKIDGNTLTWKMDMTVPMPLTLEATATIDGDTLTGTVNAGAFGAMPMTGSRKG